MAKSNNLVSGISKYQVATSLAIFFHFIGLAGLLFGDQTFFIQATPYNLLLSFALLIWTQENRNSFFYLFVVAVFITGFLAEVAGVNTGLLFGNYTYGNVLGIKWKNVPLLIGINWFIIIYCSGISTHALLMKVINRLAAITGGPSGMLKATSVIVDGATLAVLFDWLIEPVAVKLGYWQWLGDGNIPMFNYLSWFVISALLLTVFHFCKFNKQNKFAVNLLLIQFMFFLVLRTFLK